MRAKGSKVKCRQRNKKPRKEQSFQDFQRWLWKHDFRSDQLKRLIPAPFDPKSAQMRIDQGELLIVTITTCSRSFALTSYAFSSIKAKKAFVPKFGLMLNQRYISKQGISKENYFSCLMVISQDMLEKLSQEVIAIVVLYPPRYNPYRNLAILFQLEDQISRGIYPAEKVIWLKKKAKSAIA
jgi:hypothetical protein